MKKGRPEKYNRITCQQKYLLRRLILKEKMSVKQAAKSLNINYSTAKTIMFFYRKSNDYFNNSIQNSLSKQVIPSATATYIQVQSQKNILKKVQVLYSTQGSQWIKFQGQTHQSTDQLHHIKIQNSI